MHASPARILIVEDSASIALTCRLHLDGFGHQFFTATNGAHALDVLGAQEVDCILLDLDLPDMEGEEILRRVQAFDQPPSVVVVTAKSSTTRAEQTVTAGAFDYLVKPFNAARLITTVGNAVRHVRTLRQLAPCQPQGRAHHYRLAVDWTGNLGQGTAGYRAYGRDHEISAPGQPPIPGSADPAFRGDAARWNPEQLLLASLSACHKLWYLHLCADAGVVVTAYHDDATAVMCEAADGGGQFVEAVLHPMVTLAPDSDVALAESLHEAAHAKCFIARSVNFPIRCEATCRQETAA